MEQVLDKQALELAKKIVELDVERDQIWESLAEIAGDQAFELLRYVQNSY